MSSEFPLYPPVGEVGEVEAQILIEAFKRRLAKAAEEVIGDLYSDIVPHIESDSWSNFRNQIVAGLCNYNNRHIQGAYDFAKIRKAIYEEYRDEIIGDLNQDLVEEVAELNAKIQDMQDHPMGLRW